jgi:hypothetical protein
MGYFKQKLRRSRCGVEKAQLIDHAARAWSAASVAVAKRSPSHGFVRLAIAPRFGGIFSSAYELLDGRTLLREEVISLRRALAWFEQNLKSHSPQDDRAIFWFKADAQTCMSNVWAIVGLLQAQGQDVRILTSRRRPDRVVYEDSLQVAAIGDRDRKPMPKPLARARVS